MDVGAGLGNDGGKKYRTHLVRKPGRFARGVKVGVRQAQRHEMPGFSVEDCIGECSSD